MKLEKASFDDIPSRGVIAVAGAGGKTTLIHCLADHFRKKNLRVLVTTTTHMLRERDTVTDPGRALASLRAEGYAFAGAADPKNERKITAFPDKVLRTLILAADVTFIEADGARGLPFKAPQPWEPVVPQGAAGVIFVMGMDACGKDVREVCYNPEGVLKALSEAERADGRVPEADAAARQASPAAEKSRKDMPAPVAAGSSPEKEKSPSSDHMEARQHLLTEEGMLKVYETTYLRPYLEGKKGRPAVFILQNYKRGEDHMADSFFRVM